MKNRIYLIIVLSLSLFTQSLYSQSKYVSKIQSLENEKWWGAFVGLGSQMPFEGNTRIYDLARENFNNQNVPLFVSSEGRYVWCDNPFRFQFINDTLSIYSNYEEAKAVVGGKTLKEAYLAASQKHFSPSGIIPKENFFSKPQYNTWIELMYNQNQTDIMNYAHKVLEHNFPPGIFMIDDNWQKYYGNFDFKPEEFPNPKAMVDALHQMGFEVMLWLSPFVSPDSPEFRDLEAKGYLIKTKDGKNTAILHWWNGFSASYDMTNPKAAEYFKDKLRKMQKEYGIDGFKLDAGDVTYMTGEYSFYDKNANANIFSEKWAEIGLDFPYNELRTSWKLGGKELVQRLGDKVYSWEATALLIPDMTTAGLLGHAYTCPDMIGGGSFTSFLNIDNDKFDQELIVRSCQVHAMMPMMQFSVAPWRILNKENLEICARYAILHEEMGEYILQNAKKASTTGEPIIQSMEYAFPKQGFINCKDQFMLGNKYLVAPMITKGYERDVTLPKGTWKDDRGKTIKGGKTIKIDVPIERLPYFERIK